LLSYALCSILISLSSAYLQGSIHSGMQDGSEVSVYVDDDGNMEITMKGPADRWFSFGFGHSKMQNTYAIIVAEDSITEHQLDMQSRTQADTVLHRPTITVISDKTEGDYRFVKVSRSSETTENMFKAGNLDVISASGDPQGDSHMKPSYHGKQYRASDVLKLSEHVEGEMTGVQLSEHVRHSSSRDHEEHKTVKSSSKDERHEHPQEVVSEVYCIFNGEVKGVRSDEVMMHYQCSQLTERECITGGPLGQCEWVGSIHKAVKVLAVEEEGGEDVNVLDVQLTTMDMVLAIAFLVTAAFAVEQLYRYCVQDTDEKLQGSTSDAQPLLV